VGRAQRQGRCCRPRAHGAGLPTLPKDTLSRGRLDSKRICRTFSDCTTGPRNGLVSGCYPLDPAYRNLPEAALVRKIKASL